MNNSSLEKKRIAIIGSGISGLMSAYLLNKAGHEVHLFEKDSRLGGHTHTTPININNKTYRVDSGFIVFNDWTYPNFIRLMKELNVETLATNMSFSVFNQSNSFAYSGSSLKGLFSCKKHLIHPKFWKMLIDVVRFNRKAINDFNQNRIPSDISLKDYLTDQNYGDWFINRYILPMGSAIWSSSSQDVEAFPALFFIRFFHHHGLLNLFNRPQWHVIKNGSSSYIEAMKGKLGTVHLNTPISHVIRDDEKVTLQTDNHSESFDSVVFACHSDQALAILKHRATKDEKSVLGSMPYRPNQVSVHYDDRFIPQKKQARSSWNVLLGKLEDKPVLSYFMNELQRFDDCPKPIITSVNCEKIDIKKQFYQAEYHHPVFTSKGVKSQLEHHLISGKNRTYFCGAYWFNGFHEDGIKSALQICEQMGINW